MTRHSCRQAWTAAVPVVVFGALSFRCTWAQPCEPQWSSLGGGLDGGGSGGGSFYVYAFAVFDDGRGPGLYVGGDFDTAGGVQVNGIGRWDGATWEPLAGGVGGAEHPTVRALLVFDDGNGPALYAGGDFQSAGRHHANWIARWDGNDWSSLSGGVDDDVYALAVLDDGSGPALYAAGGFDTADGQPAESIARWDGAGWSALGDGIDGFVTALAVFDDGSGPGLYAAGRFTSAGGVEASGIAKWDGSAWSPVGGGIEITNYRYPWSLAVYEGGPGSRLYAGGTFRRAGGIDAIGLARWDGHEWTTVGSGLIGYGVAFSVFDDGLEDGPALYAGGNFLVMGGETNITAARWNGAFWTPVEPKLEDDFYATALGGYDDGSGAGPALYAGGLFTSGGGVPLEHVARWSGCPMDGPPPFTPCRYELVTVDAPPFGDGTVSSTVTGINEAAQVVGYAGWNAHRAFCRDGAGGLTMLFPGPPVHSEAHDINDRGQIVGQVDYGPAFPQMGFVLDFSSDEHELVQILPPAGWGSWCVATAINEAGVVVGAADDPVTGYDRAFIREDGVMTLLPPTWGIRSRALDVNDAGQVVGWMGTWSGSDAHAFLWDGGVMTDLGVVPGGYTAVARAINDHGQIAIDGRLEPDDPDAPTTAAYLWDDGTWTDLGILPGQSSTWVHDLNDRGQVVGEGFLWEDGVLHALESLVSPNQVINLTGDNVINEAGWIAGETAGETSFPVVLAPVEPSPGDIDGDCRTEQDDLMIVIHQWGRSDSAADCNGDGVVDAGDLLVVLLNWG